MSLVVTTSRPESAVQVSETRLSTLRDKLPLPGDQRKSIVVLGKRARFALGWVGFARGPGHDTGVWLRESLCAIDAVELPLDRLVWDLTGLATRRFATLRASAQDKRCHFILAGWHSVSGQQVPFTCVIYNDLIFHEIDGERDGQIFTPAAAASPSFMCSTSSLTPIKRPFLVTVVGDFDAMSLKIHFQVLKGLLKRGAATSVITAACRRIVLEASRQRENTVGKTLLGVELERSGPGYCSYYNEDGSEEMLFPDVLSTNGLIANPTLTTRIVGGQRIVTMSAQVARRTGG
jgi:hypothetical protein